MRTRHDDDDGLSRRDASARCKHANAPPLNLAAESSPYSSVFEIANERIHTTSVVIAADHECDAQTDVHDVHGEILRRGP